MVKLAVIADVHGNLDALEAVLADIQVEGVDQILNLGDHVSGPLDARGTADRLMDASMLSIRGNHDRWVLAQSQDNMGPSDRVAAEQMTDAHKAWLANLPFSLSLDMGIYACHGTPKSDEVYWLEAIDAAGTPHLADLAHIEAQAGNIDAKLLLCAHTHIPRSVQLSDGRQVVNPGSVGCPAYDDTEPCYHIMQTGSPDARYAIVEGKADNWAVNFKQVHYNSDRMVALARHNQRMDWACALETGWLRLPA
ncbi:MAG: metallophosphoesterase family protein [Pseudomonadota bacterium]